MATTLESIAALSMITDFLFRMKQEFDHMTPEEFKEMLDTLQIRADDLEAWLRLKQE